MVILQLVACLSLLGQGDFSSSIKAASSRVEVTDNVKFKMDGFDKAIAVVEARDYVERYSNSLFLGVRYSDFVETLRTHLSKRVPDIMSEDIFFIKKVARAACKPYDRGY